jgi:UDP-glucose 6-dehydrogenase
MSMKPLRLSIIGLGKLGSPMAAVFAHKGYSVVGLDINADFVASLAAGKAPVEETGLQELIDKHRADIRATTDWNVAVGETDVTFMSVGTPTSEDGGCDFTYVRQASRATSELNSVAYMERRVTKGAPAGMASDMPTSSTMRS